jgi:predicted transcriptional regulator
MSDRITRKAHDALMLINAGKADLLSWQMIDRLSKAHLIDITTGLGRDGWFLTEKGKEAISSL